VHPTIESTGFGYIVVEGRRIENDIVIGLSGKATKRRKKLSKATYGTSHIVSRDEAEQVYEDCAERIIIGSGQYGRLSLSQEASEYFEKRNCVVELFSTPEAIQHWNEAKGSVIGLFHVTC
jgi:hypothetical protein